jgi:repressor of nif and glnA expression
MIITHENRNLSNESVDKQLRYMQILNVLDGKEMTAKEIAVEMNKRGEIPTDERNFTAPRLTELSIKGIVEPIGKKKCSYTGKTVSVYKIR